MRREVRGFAISWARRTLLLAVAVVAFLLAFAPPGPAIAGPPPDPYGTGDYGGFRNILPSGENGLETGSDIFSFESTGAIPAHWNDQNDMYANLVHASPGLTAAQVPNFYKDGTFGVQGFRLNEDDDVAATYSPPMRPGVTIVRDAHFGVPHVYGLTRDDVEYGSGYVSAEDRLFFMDVLRHAGRAQLSGFAGGSNRGMDAQQWEFAPYTEADLQKQYDLADDVYGAEGVQLQRDVTNYVAGINDYISEARTNPNKMPGEYAIIGQPLQDWTVTDVIATASLIGGIFGKGGGNEVGSAQMLEAAQARFGPRVGKGVWRDFREAEDPEAPTTVRGTSFPYEVPRGIKPEAVAIPDPGSVVDPPGSSILPSGPTGPSGLLQFPSAESNALLVSGANTVSGHPVAVMGPQVAYFIPEVLMEEDLHCLGDCGGQEPIDARGATFPGVSLYVLLGRGPDYAWSATSAGQDIIDSVAEELCEPDGSQPTINSTHYLYNGECLPMDTLSVTNVVTPNAADQCSPDPSSDNPCGAFTLTRYRTIHGIVYKLGTVKGKPVAFVRQRSSYFHEADSALAFVQMNDPTRVRNAQDFQQAMYKMNLTFNWFYADDRDIAYFNSGRNPVRDRRVDPNFPNWGGGRYDWQNFDPDLQTEDQTPMQEHPQVINQPYITSWNNKQAPGYRAADDNLAYGTIHRSLSLDHRIDEVLNAGQKFTLPKLIDAMEGAGTVDLRGSEVLPYMLQVVGAPSGDSSDAVNTLQAWVNSGAHRLDRDGNGQYDAPVSAGTICGPSTAKERCNAIQIMDAWWPRAVGAEFKGVIGQTLYDSINAMMCAAREVVNCDGLDDNPNNGSGYHVGSAYIGGWYGYVQKDLRALLGLPESGAYSRIYCGNGNLTKCRNDLRASLRDALAVPASQLYDEDSGSTGVQRVDTCPASFSDQMCWDSVRFRPLGAVHVPTFHWINRPTWQQAVEVQGHRPR
jgi:acyl-homoserine lactone acylase PvdQ